MTPRFPRPEEQREMSEAEFEKAVTEAIADTAQFDPVGQFMVCRLCGQRFYKNYIGKPLNERMIEHFQRHLRYPPVR